MTDYEYLTKWREQNHDAYLAIQRRAQTKYRARARSLEDVVKSVAALVVEEEEAACR